jgi:hypothetical protein
VVWGVIVFFFFPCQQKELRDFLDLPSFPDQQKELSDFTE